MFRKTCQHCKTVFQSKSSHPQRPKYCPECRIITLTCEQCGKLFERRRIKQDGRIRKGITRTFCGMKCSQLNMARRAAKARENKVVVICPNCGEENIKKASDVNRPFCNSRCYGDYRSNHPEKYPNPFADPTIHAKAMKTRKRRGHNWSKGRRGPDCIHWRGGKVHYRGPSWPEARQSAIDRDGPQCVSCGKPGKQAHHIIPFRQFDYRPEENRNDILANHIDNLIHLCFKCHGIANQFNNQGIPQDRIDVAKEYRESIRLAKLFHNPLC